MYVSELIIDYIEHLEVEGGRSVKTAENYRLYLERFVEFTGDIDVAKITSEVIRKYRLWLNRYKNNLFLELWPNVYFQKLENLLKILQTIQ